MTQAAEAAGFHVLDLVDLHDADPIRAFEADVLRCRVRDFSDGGVLGSQSFVQDTFLEYCNQFGLKRSSSPRKLRNAALYRGCSPCVGRLGQPAGLTAVCF